MVSASQGEATQVSVQLSQCRKDDAEAVLTVLCGTYASDRVSPQLGDVTVGTRAHTHPAVWSSSFDVEETRGRPGPTTLHEPVAAELQGSTQSVNKIKDTLERAFSVHEEDEVAGDQEKELRLRLESGS